MVQKEEGAVANLVYAVVLSITITQINTPNTLLNLQCQ